MMQCKTQYLRRLRLSLVMLQAVHLKQQEQKCSTSRLTGYLTDLSAVLLGWTHSRPRKVRRMDMHRAWVHKQ